MVRPMVLEFQDDPTTQRLDLQYMFGESFLVVPVLTKNNGVTFYLPKGNWVDFWTKKIVEGGSWLTTPTTLDNMPLFVRSGSIIPMGPEMDFVDQKQLDPLTIEIYEPGEIGKLEILDENQPPIIVFYERKEFSLEVSIRKAPGLLQIFLYGVYSKIAHFDNQLLNVQSIPGGCMLQFDAGSTCDVVFELDKV
jgi:alpha-D-xyloside xylohydrolase